MKRLFLLLSFFISNLLPAQDYKPESKVEIEWSGAWYKGSILEVKDDKYKITYQGYSSSWDELVNKERLRPVKAEALSTSIASNSTTSQPAEQKVPAPAVNANYAKTAPGKLYLKTYFWTGMYGSNLSISWIYLGNDGTVVRDPKNGVNPIDYKAELANNEKNVGKYKIEGSTITVTWNNGTTSNWKTTSKNGEYATIDGGIVTRQRGMPANYRLNGTFTASAFLPNVSSVNKFTFKPDGTFALYRSGSISTPDVSKFSDDELKGTYRIDGNTLRLNYANGDQKASVICVWDDGNKKNLVINSSYFPQQ